MSRKPPSSPPTPAGASGATTEELCLLAPGQLSHVLQYVAESALPGSGPDPGAIAQAWRDAREVYRRLEVDEAGAADDPQIKPFPKALAAYQAQLVESPALRHTFDTVPVAFCLVELDTLVISQYTLTRAVVDRLQPARPARPSPRHLAELCLPLVAGAASFELAYHDDSEFVFVSDAHDMRFLTAQVVDTAAVAAMAVPGHTQAAVALAVGFSPNVMNAVRFGNRVVLNNGHHRAHALRAMGVTHVPCIVQACGSHAELREAAPREICDNSELYFEAARPPMLRDFDRPELTLRIRTPRLRRQVRLSIRVESRLMAM